MAEKRGASIDFAKDSVSSKKIELSYQEMAFEGITLFNSSWKNAVTSNSFSYKVMSMSNGKRKNCERSNTN